MKRIELRLREDTVDRLAELAFQTRMSVSENIRQAVEARLIAHGFPPAADAAKDAQP